MQKIYQETQEKKSLLLVTSLTYIEVFSKISFVEKKKIDFDEIDFQNSFVFLKREIYFLWVSHFKNAKLVITKYIILSFQNTKPNKIKSFP